MKQLWSTILLAVAALLLATVGFVDSGNAAQPGETDLKLTKSASSSSIAVGSNLTYTIKVENLGLETATGVTVTDSLPKGVDHVSASVTSGSCKLQARKLTCSIGTLETGPTAKVSSATVTLVVTVHETGSLRNTASVKGDQKDGVRANNQASVSVKVTGPRPPATCRGIAATIVGTDGANRLVGTGGRDVIAAFGGSDAIFSGEGRDLICAGAGNDYVVAGSAADRVLGGGGRDRLVGRGGPDLLQGNAGNDSLIGGSGADRLLGGTGFDVCRPGPGLDSVRACER
jgi:uncharacterized repeat protein (TIGR01451 family)